MCTLTIAYQSFPTAPIVVGANRDEQTDRPSTPPHKLSTQPHTIAPIDDCAGGTWIGYNEHQLFVAITNRWLPVQIEPTRSRGLLVLDALAEPTTEHAQSIIEQSVTEHVYDGFNLLVADPDTALLFESDGTLTSTTLSPGIHVIMNAGFDDTFELTGPRSHARRAQAENANRIQTELEPEPNEAPDHWLDRVKTILSTHEYGVCIHADGYGTRSSSLITMYIDQPTTYEYANGPPCETTYTPVNDHI